MLNSQINNAQADYERHSDNINKAEGRADILAHPVAFGMIIMEEQK